MWQWLRDWGRRAFHVKIRQVFWNPPFLKISVGSILLAFFDVFYISGFIKIYMHFSHLLKRLTSATSLLSITWHRNHHKNNHHLMFKFKEGLKLWKLESKIFSIYLLKKNGIFNKFQKLKWTFNASLIILSLLHPQQPVGS